MSDGTVGDGTGCTARQKTEAVGWASVQDRPLSGVCLPRIWPVKEWPRIGRAIGAGVLAAMFHGGRNSGWYGGLKRRQGRWANSSPHWDESEPADVPLSPLEAVTGAILFGGLFGAGCLVTRRFLLSPDPLAGALYGGACFAACELIYAAIPAHHRPTRRLFREPGTALASLTTAGAAVAWFSGVSARSSTKLA